MSQNVENVQNQQFFPLITIKEYVLYTRLNVDNYYGQPFRNTG